MNRVIHAAFGVTVLCWLALPLQQAVALYNSSAHIGP